MAMISRLGRAGQADSAAVTWRVAKEETTGAAEAAPL